MTMFDLLFILLFLVAAFSLATASWLAFRHQGRRSRKILARILVCAAVYFVVVIVTSLFLPRRFMKPREQQCFDDMCVSVQDFVRTPLDQQTKYDVNVRISSRARRTVQRENNLVMYLTDDRGRRYDPVPEISYQPFNSDLKYDVNVRISSRARRTVQRENNLVMYLTDDRGRRYDPVPEISYQPFN